MATLIPIKFKCSSCGFVHSAVNLSCAGCGVAFTVDALKPTDNSAMQKCLCSKNELCKYQVAELRIECGISYSPCEWKCGGTSA